MGWTEFSLVLTLFLLTHFLPSYRPIRARLLAALGRPAYFALYGTASTVLLVWIVVAAAQAPYLPVLDPAPWQRWVPNIAMPVAFIFLAMGVGLGYPHTLGGRAGSRFDPDRPGLAAISRHPMLWALAIWAAAHAVANPDLAHMVVFGLFLIVSLAAMRLFDRRGRLFEAEAWPALQASTATLSLRPLADRQWRRRNRTALATRVLAALLIYAALLHLHAPVIGVSPLP